MADNMTVGAGGAARTTRTAGAEGVRGEDACKALDAMVKEGQKSTVSPGDASASKEFDFAKINMLANECQEFHIGKIRQMR